MNLIAISKGFKTLFNQLKTPTYTLATGTNTATKANPINWDKRPTPQYVLDIDKWRRALGARESENPVYYPLVHVYEKTLLDSFLTSQIGNRFSQTLGANFTLEDASKNVDEDSTKALADSPIYSALVSSILDTVIWGHTLIQFNYDDNDNLSVSELPRTNIDPNKGLFFKNYTDTDGIKYREMREFGTWILEFRNDKDPLGLINKAIPHVVMKRYSQSCWSEHCEVYAVPPRVIKTNTRDSKMMARAKAMMQDFGRSAFFIMDQMEEFLFGQQPQTKGEIYQALIEVCRQEIGLLIGGAIVGQDTQYGSKSKETANQDLLWYRVQADMKLVEQTFNQKVMPALAKHGLIKEGLTFKFEKAEDISQLWTFVKDSMPFYEYAPDWLKQKFGIEVIASKSNNQSQGLSLSKSFFLGASDTTEAHLNCCGNPHMIQLSNSFNADKITKSIWEAEGLKRFDVDLFKFTANELSKGFNDGYKQGNKVHLAAFGLEYGYDSPAKLTAYEMNLFRFSAGKTIAQVQALNKAFRNARSFEDFRISAALIAGQFNENWLRTEYNTAIAVGNSAAQYDRLMSTANTFPYWEYRTQDDNRVRLDHQLLDGITLRADDPLWKKIYPPNGWNCRCFIAPRLASEVDQQALETNQSIASNFVESDGWQNVEKAGFGVNRAEAQEVFTNNQQYVKRVEANKLLAELSPSDYNIKVPDNKPTRELFTGTIEEYIRDQGTDFTDYNKRKISFSATDMTAIAEASNELFAELQNVLQKPDEVWFTGATKGKDLNQYLYVKYYNDTAIALIAEMTKDGLTVVNFLKLLDQVLRWGLLIK